MLPRVENVMTYRRADRSHKQLHGSEKCTRVIDGEVVAFCIEKSCRPPFAAGATVPSRVRLTEKDNARTSGLKSEFIFGSAFANRTAAASVVERLRQLTV
jgi:hypothetical protein